MIAAVHMMNLRPLGAIPLAPEELVTATETEVITATETESEPVTMTETEFLTATETEPVTMTETDIVTEQVAARTLTIASGTVASDLTGFVVRVDMADIEDGTDNFWGLVASDGSNIRVYDASMVELPIDIVWVNPIVAKGELFFRANLATATDNVFTIQVHEGEVAPTEALGREGVWADYEAVVIYDYDIDRTGNNTMSGTGISPTFSNTATSPALNDEHQGATWDGTNYYVFDTTAIRKYDSGWSLVASNTTALADSGISGVNHIGDGCVIGTELFVPLEEYPNSPYDNQHIAVYSAVDLSFLRSYDISAQGHETSSITLNPIDGLLYVTAFEGTNSDTRIYKYSQTGVAQGFITTSALGGKQGICYYDGDFYVTEDGGGLFKVPVYGGTYRELADSSLGIGGVPEGIFSFGDGTFGWLWDSTTTTVKTMSPITPLDWFRGNGAASVANTRAVTGTALLTQWTMGVSVYLKTSTANAALLSYTANGSVDSNRATMSYRVATDRFGIWNSTDSWLEDTSILIANDTRYRMHHMHDGTTNRTIWRDGVLRATDTTVAQRPVTGDRLYIGHEDTSVFEVVNGAWNYVYLRSGVLSPDWIAAEQASWEGASFYTIT